MGCLLHKWDGCKCSKCGKTRDAEHNWDGCTCKQCGKVRDQQHVWSIHDDNFPREFKVYIDRCTCAYCGKTRDEHHLWKCGVCELCGKKAPLMGHESGIRKLNGSNVETYCSKCNMLFKTEPENVLYDSVIRRLRDAESAGCSDPEAEIILEWLREAAKR